jgi:two-component system, chemotaxis family, chemotaxis protein CheY
MQILIVDKSRAQRNATSHFLQDLGFKVQETADGTEALRYLKTAETPDGVLVDWDMPGMNGLQFIQQVRQDPKHTELPIILMADDKFNDRVAEALKIGADEVLMKPFTKEVLATKLELLGIESADD